MIDFLKGTVGKDYFSDRLYGCQECIAEYLASKEPLSQPTNQSFTNRFIESRIIWIGSTAGFSGVQWLAQRTVRKAKELLGQPLNSMPQLVG